MRMRAMLAAALAVPVALGGAPASAKPTSCGTEITASRAPADALRAGRAFARGLFVTYGDRDTVFEGGTVVPPDLSSPLAEVAVDRTGLGSAIASPIYSPYSDAAGLPNAFIGTELPLGGVTEPSRAKVTGRPPQQQDLALAGGPGSSACVRLVEGPVASAAAVAAGAAGDVRARVGDVRALAGPRDGASGTSSAVVLLNVVVGDVHIEQVVLFAQAVADGRAGRADASSVVSGVSVGGREIGLGPGGFVPGRAATDLSALEAAGVEVVSAGRVRRAAAGGRSVAYATGPVLRITSPDGRVITVVLGQAGADAQLERTG